MSAATETDWSARATTPEAIDAALRDMLQRRHAADECSVPGRTLNLVCVVDAARGGEVAGRLDGAGRLQASRTVVCAVEPGRTQLDARATVSADARAGARLALREEVVLAVGPRHLTRLATVVDPLLVTDLPTVAWSPHGHAAALDELVELADAVLLDLADEPDLRAGLQRACELSRRVHVVDLAWMRSTPWRERVAATFDPGTVRADLRRMSAVRIRHEPGSAVVGLLLIAWLASRLDWELAPLAQRDGGLSGTADRGRGSVALALQPEPAQQVRGLAGLTLETATGRHLALDRGPGGLRAHYRNRRGEERRWTVLGASRGEPGILGEGLRQALLRDPTYRPAVWAARDLVA